MDAEFYGIAISLLLLGLLLWVLSIRSLWKFAHSRLRPEAMWGSGLALAAAAMNVEMLVYVGIVTTPLLQSYIFLSAAIVGVLSLGATKILRSPRLEAGYSAYTVLTCALVGVFSFITPLPDGMVTNGIITGNPPLLLLILSSLVTVPATVVLLSATVLSLRRSKRWQTLLMAAGAIILGAGGVFYIASFPVALYYAEFIGICVLFVGLLNLPQPSPTASPVGQPAAVP
ncbi:MAG: hypothetical protein L3K09_08760 [Thermoplasmata archaeon]|nr:hypothetical protein [Thermoplasmata archaeon]